MNLARIGDIASRLESHAVIGAYALIARGYVRNTNDFDLLTTDSRVLQPEIWERERAEGMHVGLHRGDVDDPVRGAARIRSAALRLDVVLAKYKWQAAVIARAEPKDFNGVVLRVVRAADLIALKVDAGGYLDLQDAAALLELGPRAELVAELNALAPSLPETLQRELSLFLQNNSPIG